MFLVTDLPKFFLPVKFLFDLRIPITIVFSSVFDVGCLKSEDLDFYHKFMSLSFSYSKKYFYRFSGQIVESFMVLLLTFCCFFFGYVKLATFKLQSQSIKRKI